MIGLPYSFLEWLIHNEIILNLAILLVLLTISYILSLIIPFSFLLWHSPTSVIWSFLLCDSTLFSLLPSLHSISLQHSSLNSLSRISWKAHSPYAQHSKMASCMGEQLAPKSLDLIFLPSLRTWMLYILLIWCARDILDSANFPSNLPESSLNFLT